MTPLLDFFLFLLPFLVSGIPPCASSALRSLPQGLLLRTGLKVQRALKMNKSKFKGETKLFFFCIFNLLEVTSLFAFRYKRSENENSGEEFRNPVIGWHFAEMLMTKESLIIFARASAGRAYCMGATA